MLSGNQIRSGRMLRIAIGVLLLLTAALLANAAIEETSVDIRGSVAGNGITSWTGSTFAGFFYDIDDNLGTETLTITTSGSDNRTIAENALTYSTSGQQQILKVVEEKYNSSGADAEAAGLEQFGAGKMAASAGYYTVIGWQGEPYVAIKAKSNKLSKLLVEQGTSSSEKKTIAVGDTWEIGGGFALTANSIDANASPMQVWLTLTKDGVKKDDKVVTAGTTSSNPVYTYVEKSFCGENDVPILVTYVDSIFKDATTYMVQFRYTWLINLTCTEVKSGDVYGSLKVVQTAPRLTLNNSDTTMTLSQDSVVDVMGNIKLRVADSTSLRYYPFVLKTQPGTYEVRGSIAGNGTQSWDNSTFAGFYYDIDYNLGAEKLSINTSGQDNRTIIGNALVYSTSVQQKPLKVVYAKYNNNGTAAAAAGLENFSVGEMAQVSGYYSIIGWQGEPYVAIKAKENKLSKLLVEHGTSSSEKKTLTVGETWEVGGGYNLTANSIDAKTSPRQVWLTLSKDGVKKDDKNVTAGTTDSKPVYTYVNKSLAEENDVPVFVTYVDSIFAGATTDMVQFRYTWLISSNVTMLTSGDKFGIFNVTEVNPDYIILKNENTVNLSAGNIPIMDTFNISVANSSDLRYYPSKLVIITAPSTSGGGGGGGGGEIRYNRIYLQNGWNLISLPLVPLDSNYKENTSIQRITSSISDNIIKIVSYNTTALALGKPPWEVYYPGDEVNSTLKELKTGQGYFIKTNETTFLNIYGVRVYDNTPRSYKLTQGWNLMGYPSTSLIPVETALYNIQGDFSSLWMLKNEWRSYFGQQFYYMEPGYGYWIFMKKSGEVPQN